MVGCWCLCAIHAQSVPAEAVMCPGEVSSSVLCWHSPWWSSSCALCLSKCRPDRRGWTHKSHSLHPPEVRQMMLESAVFPEHSAWNLSSLAWSTQFTNFSCWWNLSMNIFCVNMSKCKCCWKCRRLNCLTSPWNQVVALWVKVLFAGAGLLFLAEQLNQLSAVT